MDLDGDGFLSMYELEYFYEEQLQRMEQLGIETLPFEDCLCQVRLREELPDWHLKIWTRKKTKKRPEVPRSHTSNTSGGLR